MTEKLWAGRFEEKTNKDVEAFTSSLKEDYRLLLADVYASKAHLAELRKINLVTPQEEKSIIQCLDQLIVEYKTGDFTLKPEYEDVHMNIESYLILKLGDVGKKIHTGRSRNDQVVTALKLTLTGRVENICVSLVELEQTLLDLSVKFMGIIMPGYTHLQKAQPILISHYYMCYFEMFFRDLEKLLFFKNYLLEMPLGAGALAGNPYKMNRQSMAEALGFTKPTSNSIDSISDRDYVLDILYVCSLVMTHFSRLSEDIILWTTEEFSFITLSDAYSTGSSIMPQKKNSDVSELTRGKTGRVIGDLMNMLITLKGLPMGYNRDLQEDKHSIFDALGTVEQTIRVNIGMLETLKINEDKLSKSVNSGYVLATDLADYLVMKGMPFREAHKVVGQLVLDAIRKEKHLVDLTFEELQNSSSEYKKDIMQYLDVVHSVNSRDSYGGTAIKCVKEQLKEAKKRLKEVMEHV